jgi:hypothetical protein
VSIRHLISYSQSWYLSAFLVFTCDQCRSFFRPYLTISAMKLLLLFNCLWTVVTCVPSKAQSAAAIPYELTWFYTAYVIEYTVGCHFNPHVVPETNLTSCRTGYPWEGSVQWRSPPVCPMHYRDGDKRTLENSLAISLAIRPCNQATCQELHSLSTHKKTVLFTKAQVPRTKKKPDKRPAYSKKEPGWGLTNGEFPLLALKLTCYNPPSKAMLPEWMKPHP